MAQIFTFECGPLTASVYWAENIPSKAVPKGWIADVSLIGLHMAAIATDAESGKNAAVLMARHLCEKHQVDIPECLNEPHWISDTH